MGKPLDIDTCIMAEELPTEVRNNLQKLGGLYIKRTGTIYSIRFLLQKIGIDVCQQEEIKRILKVLKEARLISMRRNDFVAVVGILSPKELEMIKLFD
jgi:hypothetical protein